LRGGIGERDARREQGGQRQNERVGSFFAFYRAREFTDLLRSACRFVKEKQDEKETALREMTPVLVLDKGTLRERGGTGFLARQ
jgi:hypothetical protein